MLGSAQEDQQVDVRMRVQFTAPVATHRNQGDAAVVPPVELVPGLLQDIVDQPGTGLDQRANVAAGAETLVEHLAGQADGFLESGDRARLEGQFRLELAAVEQFGVHLGHRVTFLSWVGRAQAEVRGIVSSLRRVKIS